MQKEKQFIIPESYLRALLAFLGTLPHDNVRKVYDAMCSLKELDPVINDTSDIVSSTGHNATALDAGHRDSDVHMGVSV